MKKYDEEPLAVNAGLVAAGTIAVQVAAALGFDLTSEKFVAVSTFVTAAGALILVLTTRGKVWPEEHVTKAYGPGECDGNLYGDHEDCNENCIDKEDDY